MESFRTTVACSYGDFHINENEVELNGRLYRPCIGEPSVIMRGNNETFAFLRTVYSIKLDRATLSGGGFQYIQDGADCGGVGGWESGAISVEDAATPML